MCFVIMKNAEKIILFFGLFLCYCYVIIAHKIKSSYPQNSKHLNNVTNVMTEIFYTSPVHPKTVIIFHEKYDQIDSELLKSLQSKSTIIVLIKNFSHKRRIIHTQKIDVVLLYFEHYHNETLSQVLRSFSNTPWRSPMPKFFLLNNFLDKCINAEKILKVTWKFRIISYFICPNKYEDVLIFTFNPFSERAPFPWKTVRRIKYLLNRWTLLVWKYRKEDIMKNSLYFNRIEVLDGYKLIVGVATENKSIEESGKKNTPTLLSQRKDKCRVGVWNRHYMQAIAMTLNVPVRFICFPHRNRTSNYKQENAERIFKSDFDIIGNTLSLNTDQFTIYDFEYTFPSFYHQWGILTINRGLKTPIEKIQDFYGIWVLLYTIFILLVTFIVIWLLEQRRTYFATFEIIRLLIGSSLYTKMETSSLRIFFGVILIYFLIIQATFNGNLTNFLTKPVLKKHPETLTDLKNLGYDTIYGEHSLKFTMIDDINFISSTRCWFHLKNQTNAACIDNSHILRIKAWDKKPLYHISKRTFGFFFRYYYVHLNWSLSDKVNQIIMQIWQSGLRLHWEEEYYSVKLYQAKVHEERSLFIFAPIKLNNLLFAFIILVTGLICATLTFLIELWWSCKQHT